MLVQCGLQRSNLFGRQLLVTNLEGAFAPLADELQPGDVTVVSGPFQLQSPLLHQQQRDHVAELLLNRIGVLQHDFEVLQQTVGIERFGFFDLGFRNNAPPVTNGSLRRAVPSRLRIIEPNGFALSLDKGRVNHRAWFQGNLGGSAGLTDRFEVVIDH